MASFLLDAFGMGNRALVLLLATAACSADLDVEIATLTQESASCNAPEDCPVPPGRCEEVDFCEGVCHTRDKPDCQCEVSTECNDGNSCTQDICNDATCTHLAINDGPGCCSTVQNCPGPNACQLAACVQSSCSYLSNGSPGCCNTDADCDGMACVNNTCGAPSPQADLSITNSDTPDPVGVGQPITYTLAVHNAGPGAATGVVVRDVLPAGATLQSAAPPCSGSAPVTCSLGTLAAGADVTITLVVTVSVAGTATNSAAVASDHDPAIGNNATAATTTVNAPTGCTADEQCGTNQTCVDGTCQNLTCECGSTQNHQCVVFECAPGCASCPEGETCGEDHQCHAGTGGADLGLSWASLAGLHFPGDDLTLELTVTNHGTEAATSVVVTLGFPTAPTSLPDGCSGETQVICTIPTLAVEASLTLEFHVAAKSGVSTVTATVPTDSNSANDSASLTVSVVSESGPGPDLGGGDGSCGCGNEASVAGPVEGGLLWGLMVMLALRLGRRRR
jgi:uncharacterized repeat protein (TIGR01451 family)